MTDELHARAVEAARYAAASAIRDWIHEQPFSICASSNMDTCPDWPMAYEIRDVALGAALPHLEAADHGEPLVRASEVEERLREKLALPSPEGDVVDGSAEEEDGSVAEPFPHGMSSMDEGDR